MCDIRALQSDGGALCHGQSAQPMCYDIVIYGTCSGLTISSLNKRLAYEAIWYFIPMQCIAVLLDAGSVNEHHMWRTQSMRLCRDLQPGLDCRWYPEPASLVARLLQGMSAPRRSSRWSMLSAAGSTATLMLETSSRLSLSLITMFPLRRSSFQVKLLLLLATAHGHLSACRLVS